MGIDSAYIIGYFYLFLREDENINTGDQLCGSFPVVY